jgi:hypothetical protein
MNLTLTEIFLKKQNIYVLDDSKLNRYNSSDSEELNQSVLTILSEMMNLGFTLNKESIVTLNHYLIDDKDNINLNLIYNDIIPALKKMVGADVIYSPMYPNFPKQVIEESDMELFVNAFFHYWTWGSWKPEYTKELRKFEFDFQKMKEISICELNDDIINDLVLSILTSNDSISEIDQNILKKFLSKGYPTTNDFQINHNEIKALYCGLNLRKGNFEVLDKVKNATDILRICTWLSDGDVSLAENTKFKSLSRSLRRPLVLKLEEVISEEDIKRHQNKWIKLAHNLHVGDYSKKVYDILQKPRENENLDNIQGKIQDKINNKDYVEAARLLSFRPGEFARRIDELLRKESDDKKLQSIVKHFKSCSEKISTRVLLQLHGHFKGRNLGLVRASFPKGSTQRVNVLPAHETKIKPTIIHSIVDSIKDTLYDRFSVLDSLGKVYIDKKLEKCPLPTQQRSSSDALNVVARGTRLPFGEENSNKDTLRFFIYWIGNDIDLSAAFLDENFRITDHISYTRLRNSDLEAYHSGDITFAPGPDGASEFIDIKISAAAKKARYVSMNVYVYSGPNFADHEKCYAGWMLREKPQSNEIYDPRTVINKIDLTGQSRRTVPILFDLHTREAIWVDVELDGLNVRVPNNIENSSISTENVVRALTSLDNKTNLYELLELHGASRGELVENKEDADTVFSLTEGILPTDINKINSELII